MTVICLETHCNKFKDRNLEEEKKSWKCYQSFLFHSMMTIYAIQYLMYSIYPVSVP